jgi:hypothetical protein
VGGIGAPEPDFATTPDGPAGGGVRGRERRRQAWSVRTSRRRPGSGRSRGTETTSMMPARKSVGRSGLTKAERRVAKPESRGDLSCRWVMTRRSRRGSATAPG